MRALPVAWLWIFGSSDAAGLRLLRQCAGAWRLIKQLSLKLSLKLGALGLQVFRAPHRVSGSDVFDAETFRTMNLMP